MNSSTSTSVALSIEYLSWINNQLQLQAADRRREDALQARFDRLARWKACLFTGVSGAVALVLGMLSQSHIPFFH